MNTTFMLDRTPSTDPVLIALAILLVLGRQAAGYYGAARFILPSIDTRWWPGTLVHRGSPVLALAAWSPIPRRRFRRRASGELPGPIACVPTVPAK